MQAKEDQSMKRASSIAVNLQQLHRTKKKGRQFCKVESMPNKFESVGKEKCDPHEVDYSGFVSRKKKRKRGISVESGCKSSKKMKLLNEGLEFKNDGPQDIAPSGNKYLGSHPFCSSDLESGKQVAAPVVEDRKTKIHQPSLNLKKFAQTALRSKVFRGPLAKNDAVAKSHSQSISQGPKTYFSKSVQESSGLVNTYYKSKAHKVSGSIIDDDRLTNKKISQSESVDAHGFENNMADKIKRKRDCNKFCSVQGNGEEKSKEKKASCKTKSKDLGVESNAKKKLNAGRFRYLNERLYMSTGKEAFKMFKDDPEAFQVYHSGFQAQASKWPVNPLDVIIKRLKEMSDSTCIADFGCGDAFLAESLPENKTFSFDLVASKPGIIACDIAKVPLGKSCIDVAVFCLSLMGTNLSEYICEANRVLRKGGLLEIAEITSRFDSIKRFTRSVESLGFHLQKWENLGDMFRLFTFQKVRGAPVKAVPQIQLKACQYKHR